MEDLNIRNFKLINGDNIIALVSSNNRDNYLIEMPVSVFSTMIGGYQFAPWFPFSKQKQYSIDKHNIVGDSSIVEEIKGEYIKYALEKKKPFQPPESQEDLINRLTATLADRFELEDEIIEDDEPLSTKETVH